MTYTEVDMSRLQGSASTELAKTFGDLVDRLADIAPSDANLTALIETTEQGFFATLKLVSSQIRFVTSAFSRTPLAAFEKARHQVKERIGEWRDTRKGRLNDFDHRV